MPLSIESEIDLLYHLSTMSEHVLPKGIFYLLLWKRLNQSGNPPAFSFDEMIEHLRILYDESVFDNPELPASNDHDFQWYPNNNNNNTIINNNNNEKNIESVPVTPSTPTAPPSALEQPVDKEQMETTPLLTKTRKRASSPSSNSTTSTPNTESGRRSSRQRNAQSKDEDEPPVIKSDKRKSVKETSRVSTRSIPANDSIGTRLRGQK